MTQTVPVPASLLDSLKARWRPTRWGGEHVASHHPRCLVRHRVIRPGARTETEAHFHRVEHWVVLQGAARASVDDEPRDLLEGDTLDLAVGARHWIENPGRVDLHLISIEMGGYLEDDDVIPATGH
ncbi:phosphomannose isomerase type II C-terminal cupin domain [Rhodovulum sp. YNF3179]|uniref:phosphomannose isomerase type II C-terminal cupin domain n=1 Tax=Rhodovulum sp. YNF3179 TaxID=3425127 RepID=UPI003D351FA5